VQAFLADLIRRMIAIRPGATRMYRSANTVIRSPQAVAGGLVPNPAGPI
jgi:hypothetical protein